MHSRIKIKGRTYITPGWHGCWSAHSRVIRWVLRLTSVLPSMDSSSVFFFGCSYEGNLLLSHAMIDGSIQESLHSNQDHFFGVPNRLLFLWHVKPLLVGEWDCIHLRLTKNKQLVTGMSKLCQSVNGTSFICGLRERSFLLGPQPITEF